MPGSGESLAEGRCLSLLSRGFVRLCPTPSCLVQGVDTSWKGGQGPVRGLPGSLHSRPSHHSSVSSSVEWQCPGGFLGELKAWKTHQAPETKLRPRVFLAMAGALLSAPALPCGPLAHLWLLPPRPLRMVAACPPDSRQHPAAPSAHGFHNGHVMAWHCPILGAHLGAEAASAPLSRPHAPHAHPGSRLGVGGVVVSLGPEVGSAPLW